MISPAIITAVTVAAIVVWAIAVHNRLVHLHNVRHNAFANVDALLLQRYDLVPQLVSVVSGYAAHEKSTLEGVILARAKGLEAISIDNKLDAARLFSDAMVKLKSVVENYPRLKADANFMHLQEKISEIEDQLMNTRSFFNMATREYNDQVMSFPNSIVARMSGYRTENMLDISFVGRDTLLKAPEIKF